VGAAATSGWGSARVGPVMVGLMAAGAMLFGGSALLFGVLSKRWLSSGARIGWTLAHLALDAVAVVFLSFGLLVAFNR